MTPSLPGASPSRETLDQGGLRGSFAQCCLRTIDSVAVYLGRSSKIASHLATGLRGEEAALFFLRSRGYVIVARRWNTPKLPGDIDLIAWDGDTLCFIEVKTRTGRTMVPAEFSVDQRKQETLQTLASIYRKRFPEVVRRQLIVRFDVVAVYLTADHAAVPIAIDIFPAAFSRHPGLIQRTQLGRSRRRGNSLPSCGV